MARIVGNRIVPDEIITEQDTWRTNMNPQNAWGNYGINALGEAPHPGLNQFPLAHAGVAAPEYLDMGVDLSGVNLDDTEIYTKQKGEPWFAENRRNPIKNLFNKDTNIFGYQRGPNDFNVNNLGIMGILQGLGDKFQRPDAKQAAYEAIMGDRKNLGLWESQMGEYGDNRYQLTNTPSGLKIGSDILGFGDGYAKNFDSAFGSQSLEEMEQKKIDWALGRLRAGKGLGQDLRGLLRNMGYNERGNLVNFPDRGAQITDTTVREVIPHDTGTVTRDTSGWSSPGYTTRGGFTAPSRSTGTQHSGAGTRDVRGHHGNWAEGGRIGYRTGELVDEDINVQGPGFDFNENVMMASDPSVRDSLNELSKSLFDGRAIHELTPEEYDILIDVAKSQTAAPETEQGIASLV